MRRILTCICRHVSVTVALVKVGIISSSADTQAGAILINGGGGTILFDQSYMNHNTAWQGAGGALLVSADIIQADMQVQVGG